MTSSNQPKVLIFDLETAPMQSWIWSPGKQYVGHKNLVKGQDQYRIICIGYAWNDGKPAKCIDWGYDEQSTKRCVEEFDTIAKTADLIIGKNSARFDVPMLNSCRMLAGLPGLPAWALSHDDLEQQMRKYFRLPSQSLDYISKHLGLGGKDKMEMQDWIDICEKNDNGEKSLKKMVKYCKKDVEDTRMLWKMLSEHFDSKFNYNRFIEEAFNMCCKHADCGSSNLKKDGIRQNGQGKFQCYTCSECGRYAGRTTISKLTGKEGGIR